MGPPRYTPKSVPPKYERIPKDLSREFAADPFSSAMREAGSDGSLTHTSLGVLVEVWHWYETHMISCGSAFEPIANSIYDHLMRKCPDAIREVKRIAGELIKDRKRT